jgi:hypothetical protein
MSTALEQIVRDAKVSFIIAKQDGLLEATEVVQIAVEVALKIHALGSLSEEEKDAMVILALKKGLAAAGGMCDLPAFAALPPSAAELVENQLIKAGAAAVKAMRGAVPRLFAPVKNFLLACLPHFSKAAAAAAPVLPPKDAKLLQEALKLLEVTTAPTQVSAETPAVSVRPATPPAADILLPNTVHEESSPGASQ